jgi:hypothetical protein
MVILDGVDDAVVKLDGQANFAAMNQAAAAIYQRFGLSFPNMTTFGDRRSPAGQFRVLLPSRSALV